VVIVPPEGGLEFRWDSEMCWCFIHVTIKLVSGTTQGSGLLPDSLIQTTIIVIPKLNLLNRLLIYRFNVNQTRDICTLTTLFLS